MANKMMKQMHRAVPFWNSHVLIMAYNISDICAYYPAMLTIGVISQKKGETNE